MGKAYTAKYHITKGRAESAKAAERSRLAALELAAIKARIAEIQAAQKAEAARVAEAKRQEQERERQERAAAVARIESGLRDLLGDNYRTRERLITMKTFTVERVGSVAGGYQNVASLSPEVRLRMEYIRAGNRGGAVDALKRALLAYRETHAALVTEAGGTLQPEVTQQLVNELAELGQSTVNQIGADFEKAARAARPALIEESAKDASYHARAAREWERVKAELAGGVDVLELASNADAFRLVVLREELPSHMLATYADSRQLAEQMTASAMKQIAVREKQYYTPAQLEQAQAAERVGKEDYYFSVSLDAARHEFRGKPASVLVALDGKTTALEAQP